MAECGLAGVGTLKGKLSGESTLKGKLRGVGSLKGKLSVGQGMAYDDYEGPYVVTPTFSTQILHTADKHMTDVVTVNEIGVSRVENPTGGITVYIGGI